MSLKDYIKDQIISIVVAVVIILLSWVILWIFNLHLFLITYLLVLFGFGYIFLFSYNYLRKRNYYNNMIKLLDRLDQKYLITELLNKPHFLEGKIMVDSLYEIDKAMKEHINEIRYQHSELKEYIENKAKEKK